MDLKDLSFAQLAWLNRRLATHCRQWRAVLKRMDAIGWDRRESTYRDVADVVSHLSAGCAQTHRALQGHRDTLHQYSRKRSAGYRWRVERRDEDELGR